MKTMTFTNAEIKTLVAALSVASDALWDWDAKLDARIVELRDKLEATK